MRCESNITRINIELVGPANSTVCVYTNRDRKIKITPLHPNHRCHRNSIHYKPGDGIFGKATKDLSSEIGFCNELTSFNHLISELRGCSRYMQSQLLKYYGADQIEDEQQDVIHAYCGLMFAQYDWREFNRRMQLTKRFEIKDLELYMGYYTKLDNGEICTIREYHILFGKRMRTKFVFFALKEYDDGRVKLEFMRVNHADLQTDFFGAFEGVITRSITEVYHEADGQVLTTCNEDLNSRLMQLADLVVEGYNKSI